MIITDLDYHQHQSQTISKDVKGGRWFTRGITVNATAKSAGNFASSALVKTGAGAVFVQFKYRR